MSLLNHSLGDGSNFDAALRPLPLSPKTYALSCLLNINSILRIS